LLGLALFGLALYWLHHVLERYQWRDVLAQIRAIPTGAVLRAIALTAAGYASLTLYDLLGLRFAQARLPYPRVALTAFAAYAVGHNVGLNTLSGGAIRYRAYSAVGLGGKQIATIIAFCTFTYFLGVAMLLGVSLVSAPRVASVLHLPVPAATFLGLVLLALVAGYLTLAFTRRAPLRYRRWSMPIPGPGCALAQIAVACSDLLLAAGVLYVLLPAHGGLGFVAFAGLYLIAIVAGSLSTVPGGVGVFESVLLLLLQGMAPDRLLGALLAYRAIYYLCPFALALTILALHEMWMHRGPAVRLAVLLRAWLIAVTPQAASIAVFFAGTVLLFSGATPGLGNRLAALRNFVPLSVLELSHLLGSAVGVGLLIIANGLYRRLDAAWWLTLWLLCAGILFSLLKGIDYEEAAVLGIVASLLVAARGRFSRRASLIEQRFSMPWIAALLLVLLASAWLVAFAYRHVPYANDLWWEFAVEAQAPRSLRALLLAVIVAAAYALWRLLRPEAPVMRTPGAADLKRAAELIAAGADTTGNLALLGDKNLLFNEDRSGFLMYQVSGRSWVVMGDPIGPPAVREALAWRFFDDCDRMAATPVFYQVTPENLPLYVDLGLRLSKLGEEARVSLPDFSLGGASRAELRQSHRRALREGAVFGVVERAALAPLFPQLRAVSDAWLAERRAAEKGFSLGFYDEKYLSHFDCAVVRSGGRIVAFANLWRAGEAEELSVDLMRYGEGAPKGVIDFLLIECMLWGRAQGYRWFNLGMAPLSGLEDHALAPTWHKLGRLVQRYGETLYHFEGLRKFKDKFAPVWRPRYLAAPGGLSMAGALLDVTSLISGGVGKVWRKQSPEKIHTVKEGHMRTKGT
jgi:phosphatidylglycerol lysyltransferase